MFQRISILLLLTMAGFAYAGGLGTIPLKLGTIPLKLTGDAVQMPSAGNEPLQIGTHLQIDQLDKDPLTGEEADHIQCSMSGGQIGKYTAAGKVLIGDSSKALQALCFDHVSQKIEFISGETIVVGYVDQLDGPTKFQGKLIQGANQYRVRIER